MLASRRLLGTLLVSTAHSRPGAARKASSWQLLASAIVERPPTIVASFDPLQKAYLDLMLEIEAEHSLLSDHELQAIEEKKVIAKAAKSAGAAITRIKLAEDLVAEWKAELEAFKQKYPYKPHTGLKEDDVNRHIDKPLTLLVLKNIGDKQHWLFPQAENNEGETLREMAERAVAEHLGDSIQTKTLGNAPVAFHKYKYPPAIQEATGKLGAKIFFMKMQYSSGVPRLKENASSQMIWSTYDEMLERLPSVVKRAVKPAFFFVPQIDFVPFLDRIAARDELRKRQLIKE